MNTPELQLPEQCRNCRDLLELKQKYQDTALDFEVSALEIGDRVLRDIPRPDEASRESFHASQMSVAAAFISKSLCARLQAQVDVIGLYCNGTDDPESPAPQPCRRISSVVN